MMSFKEQLSMVNGLTVIRRELLKTLKHERDDYLSDNMLVSDVLDVIAQSVPLTATQTLHFNEVKDAYEIRMIPHCGICNTAAYGELIEIPMINGASFYICRECLHLPLRVCSLCSNSTVNMIDVELSSGKKITLCKTCLTDAITEIEDDEKTAAKKARDETL